MGSSQRSDLAHAMQVWQESIAAAKRGEALTLQTRDLESS